MTEYRLVEYGFSCLLDYEPDPITEEVIRRIAHNIKRDTERRVLALFREFECQNQTTLNLL